MRDAFVGGGSTLVEAARLGATVSGGDVDPLAVEIVNHQLDPPDLSAFNEAASELLKVVASRVSKFHVAVGGAMPLHYFYLRLVTCPGCGYVETLHRNRLIARDVGKVGSVVRDAALTVFCPSCFDIHELANAERTTFVCCGSRWRIDEGTYRGSRHQCSDCGRRWSHEDLQTGAAPSVLIGVEETTDARRTIRASTEDDEAAIDASSRSLAQLQHSLHLPEAEFNLDRKDPRPRSFGVVKYTDLFTDRQLLALGAAMRWASTADLESRVRRSICLAISNALSTNNLLCGYATDYGRLSALFSVRGYALPALAVELNPVHPTAGRGTLTRTLERVRRSLDVNLNRAVWDPTKRHVRKSLMTQSAAGRGSVVCQPATTVESEFADLVFFDPPYFDFIAYDELSEFHRAWLGSNDLAGDPLHAAGEDKANQFGLDLGAALRAMRSRLAPGRPLAFTYHSSDPNGWAAVGVAIDEAKLRVTGLWPLRNDAHMGPHVAGDNCEWDVVVVCRRLTECSPHRPKGLTVDAWKALAGQRVRMGPADRRNLSAAIAMASTRFGRPDPGEFSPHVGT